MKKLALLTILGLAFTGTAQAQSCALCEKVREYNREHPENNYEYYDDYVKDHKDAAKPEKAAPAPAPVPAPAPAKKAPAPKKNGTN